MKIKLYLTKALQEIWARIFSNDDVHICNIIPYVVEILKNWTIVQTTYREGDPFILILLWFTLIWNSREEMYEWRERAQSDDIKVLKQLFLI